MKTPKRASRGQSLVEFTIFSIILIILMLIPVQLAWIGVQKWQFTHFAATTARSWSVHTDSSPGGTMGLTLIRAAVRGWNLYDGRFVPFMIASGPETKTIKKGDGGTLSAQGLKFQGLGRIIGIFKPFFGFTGPWGGGSFENITTRVLLSTGVVQYEGFIPMQKEPTEQPNNKRRDNDCNGTPCDGGNGR